ncbi:MAG: gephyrin-like molybdotransferase Glp [Candidatus Hodarchaeota archaeon]
MNNRKKGFGELLSVSKAKEILASIPVELNEEEVPLAQCDHRFLSRDIVAPIHVPHFRKSAMDGYAVKAQDLFGVSYENPIELQVIEVLHAGDTPQKMVETGTCAKIATGAPLPEGADAVLIVEHTEQEGDTVSAFAAVTPKQNVIGIGSDVEKGSQVFSVGTRLNPRRIGILSALGFQYVWVWKKPLVAIISTGNEILEPTEELEPGKIYDINVNSLKHALWRDGCEVLEVGKVSDNPELIATTIVKVAEQVDLVLVSGGSSVGEEDYVTTAIKEKGILKVHGIATKPGKPTTIGLICDTLVVGLPGHPMSALSIYYIFVREKIHLVFGSKVSKVRIKAKLAQKVVSSLGRHQFLPVSLTHEDEDILAHPIRKGSSAISGLALADGFIEISERTEVTHRNEEVWVTLFDW